MLGQVSTRRISSPSPARTRLAPAVRREQLLGVARAMFEHGGYDAVTLEGIAGEAGVSPGLMYHYFGTKHEVFLAVVIEAIDGFARAVAPPDPDDADAAEAAAWAADPRDRLRAALERYLDYVLERPNGFAFVIGVRGAPDSEVRHRIDSARDVVHRTALTIVGIDDPTPEQDLTMWGWLGFVERATTRWLVRRDIERSALVELLLTAAARVL
jgi:AcrR family transcriptional regulator